MIRTSFTIVLAFTLASGVAFTQDDRKAGTAGSKIGSGMSVPVPIYKPEPGYSDEACKAKYEGSVVLQVVLNEEGAPTDIRVVKKLGLGLDEKAIESVTKWRFKPAMKDGKPVAVMVTIEVTFRLPAGENFVLKAAYFFSTVVPGVLVHSENDPS